MGKLASWQGQLKCQCWSCSLLCKCRGDVAVALALLLKALLSTLWQSLGSLLLIAVCYAEVIVNAAVLTSLLEPLYYHL